MPCLPLFCCRRVFLCEKTFGCGDRPLLPAPRGVLVTHLFGLQDDGCLEWFDPPSPRPPADWGRRLQRTVAHAGPSFKSLTVLRQRPQQWPQERHTNTTNTMAPSVALCHTTWTRQVSEKFDGVFHEAYCFITWIPENIPAFVKARVSTHQVQ